MNEQISIHCEQCKRVYEVAKEGWQLLYDKDAAHWKQNEAFRVYDGGCYFKNLNQIKRAENGSA